MSLFFCILWCANVTLAPEDNKIAVLSKGTLKGSNGYVSKGGQIRPISWTGDILLWKKAQNQAKKNKTSLKIKSIIPHFKPSWTFMEWSPSKTPSREISRHHKKEKKHKIIKFLKNNKEKWNLNIKTTPDVTPKAENPHNKGHGLKVTKWNWWKIFITRFVKKHLFNFKLKL